MKTKKMSLDKSQIMKDAHSLFNSEFNKKCGESFSELLSYSWAIAKRERYEKTYNGYLYNL